jgi:PKD repeat protein
MVRRGLAVSSLLAWLSLPACHTRVHAPADGGLDGPGGDTPAADVPGALALDFAATGCDAVDAGATRADAGTAPCTGTPPLTLTFSPVSSAALTRFHWTFGDGTPASSERAPTHVYLLPGSYDVALVAEGAVGSVSRQRAGFVEVTPVSAGSLCDVDAQCGSGLFCLCGQGAPCGVAFTHGVCSSACPAAGCGAGATCAIVEVPPRIVSATSDAGTEAGDASLASDRADASETAGAKDASPAPDAAQPGDGGGGTEAGSIGDASHATDSASGTGDDGGAGSMPTPLCLAACTDDTGCPAGLVCRALPGLPGHGTWERACVPPFFRQLGDSCRNARGQLDDGLCGTGVCADLGALGMCSASCAAGAACPFGAVCATFGNGRTLCLETCFTSAPCAGDPLLACETGNGVGAQGFLTSPPAPTATFCAPRSCTSQADCAPSGTCTPLGVGAHCVLN